jgi:hypothetical protein
MNKTHEETWNKVSKEEFKKFVDEYPRPLERNTTHIVTPPIDTWNDFTLGSWPQSMVAKISMDWLGPNGEEAKDDRYWEYFVLANAKVEGGENE